MHNCAVLTTCHLQISVSWLSSETVLEAEILQARPIISKQTFRNLIVILYPNATDFWSTRLELVSKCWQEKRFHWKPLIVMTEGNILIPVRFCTDLLTTYGMEIKQYNKPSFL